MTQTLGLDIGGANLKAADANGQATSIAFPLWQQPDDLAGALLQLCRQFAEPECLAVTMTGELADCFESKAEGVDTILKAVETVAAELAAPALPIVVWQTGSEFVSAAVAREIPLLVAAANWHGLATWVGRVLPETSLGLLLDIGSTTTDVIPLVNGFPTPHGMTDRERLQHGELLYTGVRRTPVCAVAAAVSFEERAIPVAAEFFATMQDVYLLLDRWPENLDDNDTADGRPATQACAHRRLARMLCSDITEVDLTAARELAQTLAARQFDSITAAVAKALQRFADESRAVTHVLTSGSGHWLAAEVATKHPQLSAAEVISLGDMFAEDIAECACAFAIARLASERA